MNQIITADRHNGVTLKSLRWHIPREFEPDRALCGTTLAGNFRRSKGRATCEACRANSNLMRIASRIRPVLLAIHAGQPVPEPKDKWETYEDLADFDLVVARKGDVKLTTRGKIFVEDLLDPVGWLGQDKKLFHARWPTSDHTRCGIRVLNDWTMFEGIVELRDRAKKHGRKTITCIPCLVATRVE